MFWYTDWHHFLYVALPLMAISMLAQLWLKSAYAKYSAILNHKGVSGYEAAYAVLRQAGIHDVEIEEVDGFLSDHYSPTEKKLRLSPANYNGTSIAAVGVAAHEAGHAIQHAQKYALMGIRSVAVPMASFGSHFGYIVIMIGLFMTRNPQNTFTLIGLGLIACVAVFQLINLPVEIDASRRALQMLPSSGILDAEETKGAQVMLTAAAMTYVAATIAAVWEVLYWAMRLGLLGNSRRRD